MIRCFCDTPLHSVALTKNVTLVLPVVSCHFVVTGLCDSFFTDSFCFIFISLKRLQSLSRAEWSQDLGSCRLGTPLSL